MTTPRQRGGPSSTAETAGVRGFPIHSDDKHLGPRSVPWSFVAPHEEWALRNHDQSLAKLAGRGGLSFCELAAVVEHRRWRTMTNAEIAAFVATLPPATPSSTDADGKEKRERHE